VNIILKHAARFPLVLFLFTFPFLVSCANLAGPDYYGQLVTGEIHVLSNRVSIRDVLADKRADNELKKNLQKVVEIREFAIRELGLPRTNSYTSYMNMGGKYAQWALTATPEFSVQPKMWCFPVFGCSSYLSFFDENMASRYKQKLSREGYDVSVRGVISYSTGAYFNDPAMNTLFALPDYEYAGIIFHEMAHEKLRAKSDTAFTEAFAVFVEQTGQYLWIKNHYGAAKAEWFLGQKQKSDDFIRLITTTRRELNASYLENLAPKEMRILKQNVFVKMRKEYVALRERWGGYAGYDDWMAAPMNNARIVGEDEYGNLLPVFQKLFELSGNDFPRFYEKAAALAKVLPAEQAAEIQKILRNELAG
jgi:predicted aminopeptidase